LDRAKPVVFDGNLDWRSALDDRIGRRPFPRSAFTLEAPLSVCVERDRQWPAPEAGAEPCAGNRLGAESATQVYARVAQVSHGEPIEAVGPVETIVSEIRGPVILDDTGHEVPRGSTRAGNICIRNPWPGLMQTIWGDPCWFPKLW
jgi:hypothetical protein